MNRLQVVIAVGLFLILAIFGWRTYLEKASRRDRSDHRGLPKSFLNDVKAFKDSQENAPKKTGVKTMVKPAPKDDGMAPKKAIDRNGNTPEDAPPVSKD